MKRASVDVLVRLAVLAALAGVPACSTTGARYVEGMRGFAVIKGRITRIEALTADMILPLADGRALTVSKPGCRVTIRFDEDRMQVLDLGPGMMVVTGEESDYILQPQGAVAP